MLIKSFFTNSIGTLVSRIFGFIRDMLSASILGANIYSDIFFVAFKFPNLFRRIFAEGAFTQSFIPSFIKAPHKSVFSVRILLSFFIFLLLFSDPEFPALSLPAFLLIPVCFYLYIAGSHTGL